MHTRSLVPAIAVACLALAACERAEPSVVGSWRVVPEGEWTVEMREDSTWSMQIGTLAGEGTFTRTDDDQIRLHPTGTLAEVMPGGYRAEVGADTLRLCGAAGCTDFVRVGR
jgi:hypothetical protein